MMESSTHSEASLEATAPADERTELDESWFDHRTDHPRPRSLFPKPEPGIDPIADDWFR